MLVTSPGSTPYAVVTVSLSDHMKHILKLVWNGFGTAKQVPNPFQSTFGRHPFTLTRYVTDQSNDRMMRFDFTLIICL